MTDKKFAKTADEWKAQLSDEEYRVTRQAGTERPFTHAYNDEQRSGVFACKCCGELLFKSDSKFDAGCGWPSFFEPLNDTNIDEHVDNTLGRTRTETRCAKCDAHLGHVFDDGPNPTGLRYCMNGTALKFTAKEEE